MQKVLVTSTTIPVSPRPSSYRSAEALMLADMLLNEGYDVKINYGNKLDVNDFDILALYNGMEATEGGVNMYGGENNESVVAHIERWSKFKKEGQVFSLDKDLPNYSKLLFEKFKGKFNIDYENLQSMFERSIRFKTKFTERCVIGDSHAIALYRPKWNVYNVAYCTLHGFIQKKLFQNYQSSDLKEVEFFFGNIDIRHHLCRISSDYEGNAKKLATRYIEYIDSLNVEKKTIYAPLPIENESRVIPQTGWYEKKPFWGSWQERNDVRNIFLDTLVQKAVTSSIEIKDPWNYLLNSKGELDFEHMEKPRSVHLSRNSFLYWRGEHFNIEPVKEVKVMKKAKSLI